MGVFETRRAFRPSLAALVLVTTLLVAWSLAWPAAADSWLPPERKEYLSADGSVRLTVVPRGVESGLNYFEDKVDGVEPAGQQEGAPTEARGRLERLGADGEWTLIWERPLLNEVAPVHAVVADDGQHVATFDNWHSVGYGDNVLVIYGPGGELVRSMALTDFLPRDYILTLPRSVSSLWWHGEHRLDGDNLILSVVKPGDDLDGRGDSREFVEIAVALADGEVEGPAGPQWDAAVEAAARRLVLLEAAEVAANERRRSPLTRPSSSEEREWHYYMSEAFFRLDPEWSDTYPAINVLRMPDAENYEASLGWLRSILHERRSPIMMFGSPSQDNLTEVLTNEFRLIQPGALQGHRIYIAVDDAHWPRVSAALAPSGARLIHMDTNTPIPQRPERMPRED